MKKRIRFISTLMCVALFGAGTAFGQIYEPEGLNIPGTYDGFSNPPTVAAFASSTSSSGDVTKITSGTTRWQTTVAVAASGGDIVGGSYTFLFTSGASGNEFNNKWAGVNVSMNTIQSYTHNSGSDNSITYSNGRWYTINWKDNGYTGTDAIFMETSAEPVTISSSEIDSTASDSIRVAITLSGSKSSEEKIYVRYSTDSFSTSKHVQATGSGTAYTAMLPLSADANFYVLSTTVDLGEDNTTYSDDYDMATINLDNNNGSNYSYSYGYSVEITGSAGYRLMTSPVTTSYSDVLTEIWTQGASTGGDVSNGDPNVFTWDRTTDAWQGATNLDANVVAGTGFLVYVFADDNYDGSDDAFPKTLSVSGTENAVDTAPTLNSANDGYTLVGNPFASTIDFDDATKVDLTDVAHVWDPNSSSWKTWNGTTGDITGGLITPFQGFFVQNSSSANSPSITFGSASKSSGGTFLGKAVNANSYVRLNVEGNGLSNSAWLQLSEDGSFSNKVMGDATKLQPLSTSFAQLAIRKDGELMDIAHVNTGEKYSLPLAFSSTTGGEFTLEATDFTIPSNVEVTFHDYQEGVSLLIDDSFSYQFETAKLKAQDVPPLSVITKMEVLKAKSEGSERFGLTISPGTSVGIGDEIDQVTEFKLDQNYPNPFNPSTTIKYAVGENGPVNITIYNVMGQKVAELLNTTKTAGNYQVTWNASGVSSGIYYYRLTAPGQILTRQMTLIK